MTERPRVLVVDDSETSREIYGMLLRHAGYEVIEADDGPSGLESVESKRPDLVVLDVLLPRMDGLEVLRRLRAGESTRDIPIVCVTASISDDLRTRAGELGCAGFIEKPDAAGRFLDVVRRILGNRVVAAGPDGEPSH